MLRLNLNVLGCHLDIAQFINKFASHHMLLNDHVHILGLDVSVGYVIGQDAHNGTLSAKTKTSRGYNVNKVVDGTLADKTNKFPFTFATAGAVNGQKFSVTIDGNTTAAEIGTDVTAALSDGGLITIKGLPANTTFNVTEANNTPDTYQVAVTDAAAGEVVKQTAVDPNAAQAMFAEATAITDYAAAKAEAPKAAYTDTTFTNTLNEVSPTNVVTRYAPFIFILAAAIVLLVVMRRRKSSDSEDAE